MKQQCRGHCWKHQVLREQRKTSQSHTENPAQNWGNFLPGRFAPIIVTGNHWDVGLWFPKLPQQAAMHQGSQPWYPTQQPPQPPT